MSKTLQINIAEPCHESWQQMTPNEKGRFCGSCQKTVVDFTAMTDKEILEYLSKSDHNICGRVDHTQMNRDIKEAAHKRRFSFAYIWNVVLATLLVTKTNAQVTPVKNKKMAVVQEDHLLMGKIAMPERTVDTEARGIVTNAVDGAPIPGASITVKDKSLGTASDSNGRFDISIKRNVPVELLISCIGYETQRLAIDKLTNLQELRIALKPEASAMDTVAVIAYPVVGKLLRTGGVGYRVKVSTYERVQRTVGEWMPNKDVKVFPNPVGRGNAVNVSLALKQAGEYRLEVLDASGRIVHAQLVQMPEKTRTVSVATDKTWSAGVYWLRISGKHVKNVYQSKLIVQ